MEPKELEKLLGLHELSQIHPNTTNSSTSGTTQQIQQLKGWFIQPACAITGEGLQEGLEALYDMITKKKAKGKAKIKKK